MRVPPHIGPDICCQEPNRSINPLPLLLVAVFCHRRGGGVRTQHIPVTGCFLTNPPRPGKTSLIVIFSVTLIFFPSVFRENSMVSPLILNKKCFHYKSCEKSLIIYTAFHSCPCWKSPPRKDIWKLISALCSL